MKKIILCFCLTAGYVVSGRAQSSVPLQNECNTSRIQNPVTPRIDPTATTVPALNETVVSSPLNLPLNHQQSSSSVFDDEPTPRQAKQSTTSAKAVPTETGYRKSEQPAPPLPNENYVRDKLATSIPLPVETYQKQNME